MSKAIIAAFFALLISSAPGIAMTALEAGKKVAAKRGYTGAKATCYADVFSRHAHLNAKGNWVATLSTGREGIIITPYVKELQSNCGLSR